MQACPSCGYTDQVQKISAIVSAGKGSSAAYGGGHSIYSYSSTDLANKLDLPPRPDPNIDLDEKGEGGYSYVVLFFSTALAIVASFVGSFIWLFRDPLIFHFGEAYRYWCGAGVILWVIVIATRIKRKQWTKELRNEQKGLLVDWDHMKDQWNKAYYCRRCDKVYLEGDSRCVDADKMLSLLKA